ncbi:Hypothetical_protein [Hexamita inflata]|uniref:Hypothetical_protein n=1 Tax=Hexamita inflata TaxID=28002 RepID=A0AA86QTU4_9EUKA|nr:Hypothetical protein HINF_LOCUS51658 [Hexamita inflata]
MVKIVKLKNRIKVKKDVTVIFSAILSIFILYGIVFFKLKEVSNKSVQLLAKIVMISQFLIFFTEIIVWENCAESTYVRTFGQLGFLTTLLWSRLFVTTMTPYMQPSLIKLFKYPEKIILFSYLFRISKYVFMLGRIDVNQQ